MQDSIFSIWRLPRVFMLVACTVLLSFAVHDIQLHHSHPSDAQSTHEEGRGTHTLAVSDYLHATDRKIFLLIFLAFIALGVTRALVPYAIPSRFRISQRPRVRASERYNFFLHLFKIGILHPKLCG